MTAIECKADYQGKENGTGCHAWTSNLPCQLVASTKEGECWNSDKKQNYRRFIMLYFPWGSIV